MQPSSSSVGVRVQDLPIADQVLVVARLAQNRSDQASFAPRDIEALFEAIALPCPRRASDVLRSLQTKGFVLSRRTRGAWRLTPHGVRRVQGVVSTMDLTALEMESAIVVGPNLGSAAHPLIPANLAPPSLLLGLHQFLSDYPFDRNVFGMTRFPDAQAEDLDPIRPALQCAREVCADHGLVFHLASDRAIVDDLWSNVAGHMWGCRFGIAFFEDRMGRGLSYNLTIEVGSMLMTGRRCALLKDSTIDAMPTDLVGQIYKDVDLTELATVETAVESWIRDDVNSGDHPSL